VKKIAAIKKIQRFLKNTFSNRKTFSIVSVIVDQARKDTKMNKLVKYLKMPSDGGSNYVVECHTAREIRDLLVYAKETM